MAPRSVQEPSGSGKSAGLGARLPLQSLRSTSHRGFVGGGAGSSGRFYRPVECSGQYRTL